jgi:hypothetical protein
MDFKNISALIFDIDDVVAITGKQPSEIERLVSEGKIKAEGKGADIRFTYDDVSSYIKERYTNYVSERTRAEGVLLSLFRKKRGQ